MTMTSDSECCASGSCEVCRRPSGGYSREQREQINRDRVAEMKRKPRVVACPACKYKADSQPIFTEGIRTFQNFICDTPDCPVSSFGIEWRDGAR